MLGFVFNDGASDCKALAGADSARFARVKVLADVRPKRRHTLLLILHN
jgi:hypothetical protein